MELMREGRQEDESLCVVNGYSCRYLEGSEKIGISLMVDATNDCQLNCRYCYYGKKGKQFMNVNNVFRACSNMAEIFSGRLEHVNIHYMGGEPLLAWDRILDLNRLAEEHFERQGIPFRWSMTSNLVGLDEKKAEHMIEEGAGIHCSIDGPAEIHNHNRPFKSGRGSFSRIAKAIPLALQITPSDTARVTILPKDARKMPDIAQDIFERGFKKVGLFPVNTGDWNKRAIDDWQAGIAGAFRMADKTYNGTRSVRTMIKKSGPREKEMQNFSFCGAGKGLWAIGMSGNLYFCHHHTNIEGMAIINAAASSVEEIRAAIEASCIPPKTSAVYKDCPNCPAINFCTGGCWADRLAINGCVDVPVLAHCALKVATVEAIGDAMPLSQNVIKDPEQPQSDYRLCWLSCDSELHCPSSEGCVGECSCNQGEN